MKLALNLVLFIVLAFLIYSCEEEFSPNAEFRNIYILNCVLRGDTAVQSAVISKNYAVEGTDPYTNTIDPAIMGADIRIWYKDTVYRMRDTTIARTDTSRYKSDYYYYFVENFRPDFGQSVEIEALLPNGKRLKSATTTPGDIKVNTEYSDFFIPADDKDFIGVYWRNDVANLLHAKQMKIIYEVKTSNGIERRYKQVPIDYYLEGDKYIPIYPSASKEMSLVVKMDVMDRAMQEISEGDENKGNYTIILCNIDILAFDKNLTTYYASTNQILDEYSIRLDQIDVTNIDGGYGLFASVTKRNVTLFFESEYVRSFGYEPKF
ncbi:MAG: hypothetical protein V1720_17600 [bacterium]